MSLLNVLAEAVVVVDRGGRVTMANDAARDLFGAALSSAVAGSGDGACRWLDEEGVLVPTGRDPVSLALHEGGQLQGRRYLLEVNGRVSPVSIAASPLPTAEGGGAVLAITDMSDRASADPDLGLRALADPLTGLPNRLLLQDRLHQVLASGDRTPRSVAVIFIDLDHFKEVNDQLGHDTGDRILVTIARRLTAAVRPGDTVARLGGDEFVVVCEGIGSQVDATHLIDRIQQQVATPIPVRGIAGGADLTPSVSIGVAFGRAASHLRPIDLLRQADLAMYHAKADGRGRVRYFDEQLRVDTAQRLTLESELSHAVERQQLELHYQPIVDLRDGTVHGVEALLRWNHPQRGQLLPAEFLERAEQSGLIDDIGRWVLDRAVAQLARWRASIPDVRVTMAINVSARQIGNGFPELVMHTLDRHGVPAVDVTLELTESLLLEPSGRVGDELAALHAAGVRLALDDFGTGYSPLTLLRSIPISVLKLDRSLVAGVMHDVTRQAIVGGVVGMGTALGLELVAEGVASGDEADWLRERGCQFAQGQWSGLSMNRRHISDRLSARPAERD